MTEEELIKNLARAMWQSDFDLLGYDDPKVADNCWNELRKIKPFYSDLERKARACLPVIDEYVDSVYDDTPWLGPEQDDTPLQAREVEDEHIPLFPEFDKE